MKKVWVHFSPSVANGHVYGLNDSQNHVQLKLHHTPDVVIPYY